MKRVHDGVRRTFHVALLVCFCTTALCSSAQEKSAAAAPQPPAWPHVFENGEAQLIVYQPQIREWLKFRELTSDTAISITPRGGERVVGVASWRSTTFTDTQNRLVVIKDSTLIGARFPSLDPAKAGSMEHLIRENLASRTMTISLDRMLATFKAISSKPSGVALNTEPPAIFVRTTPAILLFIDGEPIHVPIEGTHLQYVVNTNWDVLYADSAYYLLNGKTWLKAAALTGPWTPTTKLPAETTNLPAGENWDEIRKAIPPQPTKTVTDVLYTTKPAELILFKGQPTYSIIAGTKLQYATNTDNEVFQSLADRQLYTLLSGRWFRAATLKGPWAYASDSLPEDFSKIPNTHPKSRVLVSVPGTQAARDAVLLAQVPTTVVVDRAQAENQAHVVYTGEPQFTPIPGTSVSYAVNTQDKVLKLGDLYYLCFQAVWFVSASPKGPWKTADSVPKDIYEIPPSSPVYNVTYVTVSNPTPTTVESSSTDGYLGMFVLGATFGACVAYGTGYYYPPYFYWGPYPYPVYYPYPYSYGYRAVYNPATGFYGVGAAVYGPYGAAGRAAWYNPSTGRYGRAASVQTAYGGRSAAQAYNPWTGNWASTKQGHNPYAQWGGSTIKYNDDIYHTGHVKTANNLYAGVDGNVYRRDSNGNWSKWDNGGWDPVEKSGQKTGGGGSGEYKQKIQQGTNTTERESARTSTNAAQRSISPTERQQTGLAERAQAGLGEQRQAVTPAIQREGPSQWADRSQQQRTFSPDTMQQLNREASARMEGAARERSMGSWGAGARMPSGVRMGGIRR